MRLPHLAGAMFVALLSSAGVVDAQERTDTQLVQAYRGYWQQIESEFQLAGSGCTSITERLAGWVERNREDVDSLIADSQGLMDRMSEAQVDALLPGQQRLIEYLADSSGRCRATPGFREAIDVVGLVLGMGS